MRARYLECQATIQIFCLNYYYIIICLHTSSKNGMLNEHEIIINLLVASVRFRPHKRQIE